MKTQTLKLAILATLFLARDARANYLMPGDPDEHIPLCVFFVAAVVVAAVAAYSLYRIRRSHDLLPPP